MNPLDDVYCLNLLNVHKVPLPVFGFCDFVMTCALNEIQFTVQNTGIIIIFPISKFSTSEKHANLKKTNKQTNILDAIPSEIML